MNNIHGLNQGKDEEEKKQTVKRSDSFSGVGKRLDE